MSLDSLSRLPGLHRTHRTDIKSITLVLSEELMHVLKRYACIIRFPILNQIHRLNEWTMIAIKRGRSSSCNPLCRSSAEVDRSRLCVHFNFKSRSFEELYESKVVADFQLQPEGYNSQDFFQTMAKLWSSWGDDITVSRQPAARAGGGFQVQGTMITAGVAVLPWLVAMFLSSGALPAQGGEPLMPAMFILGDSLVDVGNNNYILTLAKSNFPPNGLDFPEGATGRFCNGRTVSDFIVQKMGLPFPPAYLSPKSKGPVILKGLNYASAAGGILDSTGYNYIGRISFNTQLDYLTKTRGEFVSLVGEAKTAEIFSKALWYITIGSNDYINNYLLTGSQTGKQYTPKQYEDLLIATFEQQLRRLYALGARKIFVYGVGPLGCIPSQLYQQKSPDGSCIEFINGYVRGLNEVTRILLRKLTATLPGSIYVYGNSYGLVSSYVAQPAKYGFTVSNAGCCGLGPYNGALPCLPIVKPCPNRELYLFWDPFHPTDKGNGLLADSFFSGGIDEIEPVNVMQVAAMFP